MRSTGEKNASTPTSALVQPGCTSFGAVKATAKRWWVVAFAAVVTIGVRLWTFGPSFDLRQVLAYDDYSYFAGAQILVEGHLPYRAFPFVQPPGVVIVGAPFAFVGQLFGGDVGMAALRVAIILMAGATAALIAVLLRPYGLVASLVGSMLFATWGLASLYGRTFFLEQFLSFAVVWTFFLLRRVRTNVMSYVAIGVVLGVACTIKAWAAVDIAFFAVFIGSSHGRRRLLAWLAGVLGTITAICAPFFVAAPRAMWHDVVVSQLGRLREVGIGVRLATIGNLIRIPGTSISPTQSVAQMLAGAVLLVAFAPLIVQLVRRRSFRQWSPAGWWSAMALIELVVLTAGPIFYDHYLLWPAGPLALGLGRTVGRLDNRLSRIPLMVGLLATMTVLVTGSNRLAKSGFMFPTTSVRSFAADQSCTWFNFNTLTGFVVSRSVPMWAPCRPWPDQVGAALTVGHPGANNLQLAKHPSAEFQRDLRAQMSVADSAVRCHYFLGTPLIDAETATFFDARFVQTGWSSDHRCSFWKLRPSARGASPR